jgi:hypothetical protein
MGSGYRINCSNCDYSIGFKTGIGFLYSPKSVIQMDSDDALLPRLISSKKTLSYIRRLIREKSASLSDDYGHKLTRLVVLITPYSVVYCLWG